MSKWIATLSFKIEDRVVHQATYKRCSAKQEAGIHSDYCNSLLLKAMAWCFLTVALMQVPAYMPL